MKHIRVKLLYVRELYAASELDIRWISGDDHPPDLLTKPLGPTQLAHLIRELRAWGGELMLPKTSKIQDSNKNKHASRDGVKRRATSPATDDIRIKKPRESKQPKSILKRR